MPFQKNYQEGKQDQVSGWDKRFRIKMMDRDVPLFGENLYSIGDEHCWTKRETAPGKGWGLGGDNLCWLPNEAAGAYYAMSPAVLC